MGRRQKAFTNPDLRRGSPTSSVVPLFCQALVRLINGPTPRRHAARHGHGLAGARPRRLCKGSCQRVFRHLAVLATDYMHGVYWLPTCMVWLMRPRGSNELPRATPPAGIGVGTVHERALRAEVTWEARPSGSPKSTVPAGCRRITTRE